MIKSRFSDGLGGAALSEIFKFAVFMCMKLEYRFLKHPYYWALILILIALGYCLSEKRTSHLGYSIFSVGIVIFAFAFMVAWGMGQQYYAPRTDFIANMNLLMGTVWIAIEFGVFIGEYKLFNFKYGFTNVVSVIATLVLLLSVFSFDALKDENPYFYTFLNINSVKNESEEIKWQFDEITQGKRNGIEYNNCIIETGILKSLFLQTNTDWWVNETMAEYFGCESFLCDKWRGPY